MRIIYTAKGEEVQVDDADYGWLNQYKWRLDRDGYPRAWTQMRAGVRRCVRMQRLVLGLTDPYVHGDHRDNDKLNCQRYNLRPATQIQNEWNIGKRWNNTSGFKGVSRQKGASADHPWRVSIRCNRRTYAVYGFETPELAHEFYCLAADMLHGEFANYGGA